MREGGGGGEKALEGAQHGFSMFLKHIGSRFLQRAAALASVSYGKVLLVVRVRVRGRHSDKNRMRIEYEYESTAI